ncbi:MAG: biotin/lipoyl-binding protein [Pseudomonadota bacterium]|nr:biotin/lipoyl-binding protein [Pseudomonadota bacterium]
MRKLLKFSLPLLILAAGFLVFNVLKATRPEQAPVAVQERVWRVEVEAVEPSALAPELALYGRAETPELLKVAASAQARVAEVPVRDGDWVAQGQLLVRLDERDFLPALHQAQAEVAELEAQILSETNRFETDRKALEQEQTLLEIARDGVERAQRLTKQRVGSETDLDIAEEALARQALAVSSREMSIVDHPPRHQALEARLLSARARLEEIELDFDRATVTAPYDGVVAGVEVTAGDQVKQDAVLLRIYSLASLEVRALIPAPYQAEIRQALAVEGALAATADAGGIRVPLRLKRLAGEAHPSGVDGLFAVDGDADVLRLGQMISLRLVRPERADAVAVPFQAVYGGDRIYKLVEGRMQGIRVESLGGLGDGNGGERLLVRSPELAAGDLVVLTHMPNAMEGLRVEAIQ